MLVDNGQLGYLHVAVDGLAVVLSIGGGEFLVG